MTTNRNDLVRWIVGLALAASGACSGGGGGNGAQFSKVDAGGLFNPGDGSAAIPCADDGECPTGQPYCDTARKVCVECLATANCAGGAQCDTTDHSCVQCLGHGDCGGSEPYCDTSTRSCVQCVGDGNCGGSTPHCDTATHVCVACTSDAECGGNQQCVSGTCGCTPGASSCASGCVDTGTDEANCGGCGNACNAGEQCVAGTCHPPCQTTGDCAPPLPYCDETAKLCVECLGDGNCVGNPDGAFCDLTTFSCVQCLQTADCAPINGNFVCSAGRCGCPNGQELCGNTCIDTQTSFDHCGGCGRGCDPLFETGCAGGECTCMAGLTSCGGNCTDLANDADLCGTNCGNAKQCGNSEFCNAGACTCRPGLIRCGNNCVDPKADPLNCGGCIGAGGALCQQGDACQQGVCTSAGCSGDTPDDCTRDGRTVCTNFDTDPLNCGQCGERCDRDKLCVQGNCVDYVPATPCNSCPCANVCAELVGGNAACCTGLAGGSTPICVEDGNCPAP